MSKISISSSAMLVDVSISAWSGRKLDRAVTDEVNSAKGASRSAARVNKSLFADDPRLKAINDYTASIRNWLMQVTLPWSDRGPRLVTTAQFFDFKRELDERKAQFEALVDDFVQMYPTLISAQAFKLGAMFDRDEYPPVEQIARKFRMSYTFLPVPEAGDFRVDIGSEAMEELRREFEADYQRRVEASMRDLWDRLKDTLDRIVDRLGTDEIGKNKIFRDSLVSNAIEVCDMLKYANITNDPELEAARRATEQALLGITPDELRKNDDVRRSVKEEVQAIVDKFNF